MGARVLLVTLLAALTQLPSSHALTTAAVLAALLVVISVSGRRPLPRVVVTALWVALARADHQPLLRQAVVAGPGRPQPRAPGARSCAAS